MKKLELGELYNREDVHKLFGGDSKFTPGAGTWGISGMLRTHQDDLSWVFYVTLGHREGEHQFDERISHKGVLTWQSQPSKHLGSREIIDLINFDADKHSIYLFLRQNKKENYRYLGRLSYLSHDPDQEKPVYFEWQLIDWDNVKNLNFVKNLSGYKSSGLKAESDNKKSGLIKTPRPAAKKKTSSEAKSYFLVTPPGSIDLTIERQKQIGSLGEELVVEEEKRLLESLGRQDLAGSVEHSSKLIGDGLGYDIKSYNSDGTPKYIEVKTTTQSANADFYISTRELAAAERYKENYIIYRVYDLDEKVRAAKFYTISASELLDSSLHDMIPTEYRVRLKA
ncbi:MULTISPECIES: DUF3427 domain-containing protein [Moraxella]|uniref:Protein NO VEIN C-terminal domain-containing protein n=1 Tax=Moraxella catarrhalis TaxID=480 RepID=A0A7Z0V009_MORCA|nr:DUF3427 domain-containing protein [Moraxella catarrhalis]OAV01932.1 hypothetical protein AO382_0298 [Moraxella catarrhalis]STY82152.1 Predicted HKD family nuclease [Moraxella catarrhalis]